MAVTFRCWILGECTAHAIANPAIPHYSYSEGHALCRSQRLARFMLRLRLARELLSSRLACRSGLRAALRPPLVAASTTARNLARFLRGWGCDGRSGLRAALRPPRPSWHDSCAFIQWFSGVDNLWITC